MAVSQNGYSANNRSLIHNPAVAGTNITFPGGLRRGPAGDLLLWVAEQMQKRVERRPNNYGMWGYAERPIRGGTQLSNHASGTAIDWHAPAHPLGAVGTFSRAQVNAIRQILREAEGCIRWGGDYSGRKDEMHFEVVKSEAECARVLAKLRGGNYNPPKPVLRLGDSGSAVEEVQRLLAIPVDGIFGAGTETAVKNFQRANGLTVDGVVGPSTWNALEDELSWDAQFDDPYRPGQKDMMKASDHLRFGASHAAHARDAAWRNEKLLKEALAEIRAHNAAAEGASAEEIREVVQEAVAANVEAMTALVVDAAREAVGEDLAAEIADEVGRRLTGDSGTV